MIQQGIEKVQISTVLVEQNRKISQILNRQDKLLSKLSEPTPESEFEKDIIMMRRISGIQQDRIAVSIWHSLSFSMIDAFLIKDTREGAQ